MSQNDYTIGNQSAPDFRSDLNEALQALASLSSGSTAPSTTYANMLWYDDANNILKMRSEADDAWINVGYLDQSANAFRILDDTQVVNTSGTQTGLLGGQATSVWEDGTSTTRSLVSPAEAKAAIEANAGFGVGQTWQDVTGSRSSGTTYQNTTGRSIFVSIFTSATTSNTTLEVGATAEALLSVDRAGSGTSPRISTSQAVVPDGAYYEYSGSIASWLELR